MTILGKTHALEKIAQPGSVYPALFNTGFRAGSKIRDAVSKFLRENVVTLESEASKYGKRKSDQNYFNILVGGAAAGGDGLKGLSALPFGVLSTGENRILFRHNEEKKIRDAIKDAIDKKLNPRVVGHSWGGATIANIARDFPDVPFYALDPVSRLGRLVELPKNLTIYRPIGADDGSADRNSCPLTRAAVRIGGRWPRVGKGEGKTIEYHGDHVSGLEYICDMIDLENRRKEHGPGDNVVSRGGGWANMVSPVNVLIDSMTGVETGGHGG